MGKHLDRLSNYHSGRVFEIVKNDDGTFSIWEQCDNYFSLDFTADELIELAEEIIELAKQSKLSPDLKVFQQPTV